MSNTQVNGGKLYTEKHLRQLVEGATNNAVALYEINHDYQTLKQTYIKTKCYAMLAEKYGVSRETIRRAIKEGTGVTNTFSQRKFRKTFRKIKIDISPEAVKVMIVVFAVALMVGLAGGTDATSCAVTQGVICP